VCYEGSLVAGLSELFSVDEIRDAGAFPSICLTIREAIEEREKGDSIISLVSKQKTNRERGCFLS
jgi:hypothetical protein